MKMHGERRAFSGVEVPPHQKGKVPRSSSPVTLYVEMPCNLEQAFPTIAWGDLEDCSKRENDSLGSQVNESDGDERDFVDFALDFVADSPSNLESSLSPAALVPFQGCVIPPLTPQHIYPPEDSVTLTHSSCAHAQDEVPWARYPTQLKVNQKVHETLYRKHNEASEERNLHLRQLASRAKLLASMLEKLMAVREPDISEPTKPRSVKSSSPCKRQRLETECEPPDSVEEMLRDVSARCDAALRSERDPYALPLYGSFSGLLTSVGEAEEDARSFCTSVREHGTVKTHVFPHGLAFTSGTREGGYRFRWVPNDC
ncbi:multicilin [Corythoichthys intestinalis]|uniref:multicilin n=1 Tax=Corythoichthys intestinalis TaxID=161448 RepID=UPI0025A5A7F0|nr:multicilin [Corythoichthys intestinalis]XP_061803874.1 multicilin-like [Nerophis lumbriciformis]